MDVGHVMGHGCSSQLVVIAVRACACSLLQATCLQTMYDYLIKASQYVDEMQAAFKGVREAHE